MSSLAPRTFRGPRLRELRKEARLSQTQLASRIGAHVTSVSDWERGANAPSGRHVAGLARELGVNAEHFYGDSDDEEESQMDDLIAALAPLARLLQKAQAVA